jgi:SAM-dependent methyltransferase
MKTPRVPAYFDLLIDAYRAGHAGRDVHLGYWDPALPADAPSQPGEFAVAQRRLTSKALACTGIQPGDLVLDVGCGFGGTLDALASIPRLWIVGVNVDKRQLSLCADIAPPAGGRLSLVAADATALPFPAASFACVLCIEAMFHFSSRAAFLAEAARLVRPGGVVLTTDIFLTEPARGSPWSAGLMAEILRRDFGPWPDLWAASSDLAPLAASCGLTLAQSEDWTAQTLRSYRFIAGDDAAIRPDPDGGSMMRWLHRNGYLGYHLQRFVRQPYDV